MSSVIQPSESSSCPLTPPQEMLTLEMSVENQITQYYIKKLMEKQQQPTDTQRLVSLATEEEKEMIETIDTVKTRYKLLSLGIENRPLFWKALCQSYPEDEHVGFFNNTTIQSREDLDIKDESVLRIASLYASQHTYYPGMDHLIQPLVSIMPEIEAYSVFVRMLEVHDIPSSIYQHVGDRLHDVEIMLKHTCPDLLFEHVEPVLRSWICGACITPQLLDIVMLEGYSETVTRYSVACVRRHYEHLVRLGDAAAAFLGDQRMDARSVFSVRLPRRKPINTVPLLQQQLDDMARSMALLQKEYEALGQENMQLKIKELSDEQTQTKLIKRNAVLEKRLKKYKTKLASATSTATMTMEPIAPPENNKQEKHQSFVESLRETGDFGALVAGAFSPEPEKKTEDVALQQVTSELVAVKLVQFETQQKCESLESHCKQLEERLEQQQGLYEQALQKSIYLQNELEDTQMDREQLINDQEDMVEMAMVAKKTSTELQMEKLELVKHVERLERTVQQLEKEKQNYFLPRDTFSEEVFAAHSILFGQRTPPPVAQDPYEAKYVESELRCRELEKYLAETKVKLAELESSCYMTPRTSYQPPSRRASMMQYKRTSTASLSMLANRPPRESTESFTSDTTSLTSLNSTQYNSKRSSALYSRLWNAFGTKPDIIEPQLMQ